ncbi:hypothetical protein LTR94_025778 [Friedmanniomyces endolithicus]|nr:hypothetical protein LTR94_025778 [Friedmanniomyces endolithicus]
MGGGIPLLIRSAEPIKAVALIEQGPNSAGLAGAVQASLREDVERRNERFNQAAQGGQPGAGRAVASIGAPKIRLVQPPAAISQAPNQQAQDAAIRSALDREAAPQDRLDAVVFLDREDGKPTAQVWTARATDNEVASFEIQTFRPEVTAFSPNAASGGEVALRDRIPSFIGLAAGFLLWSLVITGASMLLNSVMEEKSNRILEVLLSSASATEILTGKVLGVALLTLTVMGVWGGIGALGLISASPETAATIGQALLHDGLFLYFIAYMVGGYLMYAVLFAAIGAFCETPRDAQTLMGPIMMVLVVPIVVMQMALSSPDAPVVKFLSWFPFFTPFLMSARAPSDPALIEVILTLIGMFATAALTVWGAGRAFRAGALSDVKLSWKSFGRALSGRS